jgi:hypothetical protein
VRQGGKTALYALSLLVFLGAVVHPLRHYVVEPRRQAVLGNREPAARRLALASQFGFTTTAGTRIRLVPGQSETELRDLPTQAVTLILGGFRGPYVIWLWMNVEEEKTKRIHFNLIDRYTKIAALQADYPAVWVFHIWNLAWNVPVQFQSPEIRYQWIRTAIEFGSEGYRRNPHDAQIMAEIGRVYSEKFGRSQEAAYYRRRVKEDEGRSTFLIAYEWYDRARRANERQETLLHGLTKAVVYSQASHNLSYFAAETTLAGYDSLKESFDLRRAGRQEAARAAFVRGLKEVREAEPEWEWARREWRAQAARFENVGVAPSLTDVWRRFFNEADTAAKGLHAFQTELTYDNLPLYFAAKSSDVAYAALRESREYAGQRETERLAREALSRGLALWDEAVAAWETALASWDAHVAEMEKSGASADALRTAKDLREKAAAHLAYLKETRMTLSVETVADVVKTLRPAPVSWPMAGLSLQQ